MSQYRQRKIHPFWVLSVLLRGIVRLSREWPLLLLVAVIVSPISPHLRWEYTYIERSGYQDMINCEYLGSRGFIEFIPDDQCPLIMIIDNRK